MASAAIEPPIRPPDEPPSIQWSTWRHWESLAISLFNLPRECNTKDLWKKFSEEGTIISIDIFDDRHGQQSSRGRIRFRPPPKNEFWARRSPYKVRMRSGRQVSVGLRLEPSIQFPTVPSPVQPSIYYPTEIELPLAKLDFGVFLGENTICPFASFTKESPRLVIDARKKRLLIFFKVSVRLAPQARESPMATPLLYRVMIPFLQLSRIWQKTNPDTSELSFVTMLESPPIFHRQVSDIELTVRQAQSWRETDSWYRQTSVVERPWKLNRLKTNLYQRGQIIDIGRWNVYEMLFPNDVDKEKMVIVYNILRDHNIVFKDGKDMQTQTKQPIPIWNWIDMHDHQTTQASVSQPADWFGDMSSLESQSHNLQLQFSVRYQLEVCISQNLLSELTLKREFLHKLIKLGEEKGKRLLEHVATSKHVYHDPMQIFSIKCPKGVSDSKIPTYCCFMRTARVTPTTVYYNTPTVDISNRVTRRYRDHADRFLRVRFTDEKTRGRIMPAVNDTDDEVFTRIWRTLKNGIMIGDRHYEFLAFGNSQFREHGAYFFASVPYLTASHIRGWMGQFSHIKNVAKHAARIGQCFSTTRPVIGCPVEIKNCDDISRHGYCFSDGVGKISKFLAQMTQNELKIQTPTRSHPSAFQFRLGGSKGLLVASDDPQPKEVHIRPSQFKFSAEHTGLEIIRSSQLSPATLNRQLILVLSARGIPDEMICKKLHIMLEKIDKAMENDKRAIDLLQTYVDPNQVTLSLVKMISHGFRRNKEPFVNSMLALWKSWHLKYLKEKARVVIDQGATLLGCLDETGVLKGQFNKNLPAEDAPYEERLAALPEIFVQISHPGSTESLEIIEGVCVIARNPSLHAGDIRVVRAVNRPELKHLYDVVVFPQTGDRDIPSMCSGGDLDGDDYLIIWDQDLIPKAWFVNPMEYASRKAPDLDHDVTLNEITSFFVTYMKNDALPRIAHAHMALADRLENGILEQKCIRLAQLHSDAVDYNKTGATAVMTRDLEPFVWPHFMEKKNKRPEQIYHSTKILGQLYDSIRVPDYTPTLDLPFDKRILTSPLVPASLKWKEIATELKMEYDAAMRRVIAQYEIKTEFEVWSSFILGHNQLCKDYNLQEEIGRIMSILREGFRQQCYDKIGDCSIGSLAPFVVAMYCVTGEEVKLSLKGLESNNDSPRCDDTESIESSSSETPLAPIISFPWIFEDVLCRVANGDVKVADIPDQIDTRKMYNRDDVIEAIEELKESANGDRIVAENALWSTSGTDTDENLRSGDENLKNETDSVLEITEKEVALEGDLPAVEKLFALNEDR